MPRYKTEVLWATTIHKNIITIGQVKLTNKWGNENEFNQKTKWINTN